MIELDEWKKKKYYKSEAFLKLAECPDQVDRRDANEMTVEQFVEEYEKPCKPVVIRGKQRVRQDALSSGPPTSGPMSGFIDSTRT